MIDKNSFNKKIEEEFFNRINIKLNETQINKYFLFVDFLLKENEKYNLTSITNIDDVIIKHLIDSVIIKKFENINTAFESAKSIIDVGTGAGFPGIPLAILEENKNFLLIDSLNKRINFLNQVISICELKNVKTKHERAEDLGRDKEYREKYDIAVSRAVANASMLFEFMAPLIKINGNILLYKLFDIKNELEMANDIKNQLSLTNEGIYEYSLLEDEPLRAIYRFKKEKKTDMKYPRKMSIIKKSSKN